MMTKAKRNLKARARAATSKSAVTGYGSVIRARAVAVFAAAAFAAALTLQPAPALALDDKEPKIPLEKIEEVTKDLLKWFELMLKSIPQYAAPEVLENGDIIIRRKHPEIEKKAPPQNRDTDRT